jgi:parvulin-like peptidyl-prolyl isomerase
MKRFWTLAMLGLTLVALAAGCGGGGDEVVVRITDNEGQVEPREITVGYVNGRIERMPPNMIPDVAGDEGRRDFLEEIIQKELLVIHGTRMGIMEEPIADELRAAFIDEKAHEMFVDEYVNDPAEPTRSDIEEYNVRRETIVSLLAILVQEEDEGWDVYNRVTEGGEDFMDVAKEVSIATTAEQGGKMAPESWTKFHPVVAKNIADAQEGHVVEPALIGGLYHIYKVVGREEPAEVPELVENRLLSMTTECRVFNRTFREHDLNEQMRTESKLTYHEPGLSLAVERIAAEVEKIIPDNIMELGTEDRMEIARMKILPEFSDEEAAMPFLSYEISGEEIDWSLGDLRDVIDDTPGIEGPKTEDAYGLKHFVWRKVREKLIEHEIQTNGYRDTREVADYVEMRLEEFVVNSTYQREVTDKIGDLSGGEIREYFQSHRDDYIDPVKVDLRQIIVGSEADANMIRQRILSGAATFEEMVETYSIDEWSKPRGGLISEYGQGERRLSYLQNVIFDLEIGELSEPFPAPGGFALAEVLEIYPQGLLEFSEVDDLVKQTMLVQRSEARLEELFDEIRQTVEIEMVEENLGLIRDLAEAKKEKMQNRFVVSS